MLCYNECFHGTSNDNCEIIKSTKKFTYKNRTNHWLGQGVYFFVEDFDKAKWFVKVSRSPYLKDKKKCIIEVSIKVAKEKLLNLDTEQGRKNLSDFKNELIKKKILMIGSRAIESNSELRCLIIDAYINYFNVDAVKYTFSDDKIIYKNLNANDSEYDRIQNTGTQINVVNQSVINFDNMVVKYI